MVHNLWREEKVEIKSNFIIHTFATKYAIQIFPVKNISFLFSF